MGGAARYVGASVHRVEDARVLTGRGRYVDDLHLPGTVHAAFLRSPYAHARINGIDTTAAKALEGVVAVYTHEDLAAGGVYPMGVPEGPPDYKLPTYTALCSDKALVIGDPVAVVVAESRYVAEDGLQLIEVDYEPLDAVATFEQATAEGAPIVWDGIGTNVMYREDIAVGDVAAAFAEADTVIRRTLVSPRMTNTPMEPRGGVCEYDAGRDELTYYVATQAPQLLRMFVSGLIQHSPTKMRVLGPGDIGGSFGQKVACFKEDVVVCWAAKQLKRPVKWIEDRVENLSVGGQAREETMEAAFAVKSDGTIIGIDVHMKMDHGAYPAVPFPAAVFTTLVRVMLPSYLRTPSYRFETTIYATNKGQYVPYRGPWAAETLVRERMIHEIAKELGIEMADVYRANAITLDEQPTKMTTGPTLEGMTVANVIERALEMADVPGFRAEQEKARKEGRHLGLGFSTFIEAAPGPADYGEITGLGAGRDPAVARLEPDGKVTVITAQVPHGQGHETTLAQIAADELGVKFEDVRIEHSDSRTVPFTLIGTGGSRSATMGSGAALVASRALKGKILEIGSGLLEVAPDDLEIVDSVVRPKGVPDRGMPLGQVAQVAYFMPPVGMEGGLEALDAFAQPPGGWVASTHVCWVEVDVETGEVTIPRYLVVEDCGTMINPAIVDGQVRGGTAQGIGIALLEETVYSDEGQLLTTTFMDYLMPTAAEIPHIEIEHMEFEPLAEVNYRGVGEGGTIGAPAAVANAVGDALGVSVDRLPLSPARVLELVDANQS
ncbi:MAG: xanthine dehydrogenase family protein molybdopterin-binding subunit [Actinobacteria bacterium]|nr:xanthine dehydrogenase family protein molybdopterin-binding subunit [Actinomycetota bacterium]